MSRPWLVSLLCLSSWCWLAAAAAQPAPPPGQGEEGVEFGLSPAGEVRVPLAVYTELLAQGRQEAGTAPAPYAFGRARVTAAVRAADPGGEGLAVPLYAQVRAEVQVQTFADQWVAVPLLPVATALQDVQIDGESVALVTVDEQLAWSTRSAGQVTLVLDYQVPVARETLRGATLTLPLPPAVASQVTLELPGVGLEVVTLPAVATNHAE
ncbi:MAG: hypothetical protein ACFCBW_00805, partial [Candidatus Competibacterales bacterium]